MMKFTVNLARRPSENLRRAWVVWGGMLAVLSAVLFVLASGVIVSAWNNRRIHRQESEVQHRMAPLRRREQVLDVQLQNPQVKAALAHSQYLNQLIDRKAVSWTRLFERLETLMPADLQLISIRPQKQAGKAGVDMIVGGRTLQPAINFVSHLEAAPDFSSAQVLREGRNTNTTQPETQVRVEIQADYQPDLDPASAASPDAKLKPSQPRREQRSRMRGARGVAPNQACIAAPAARRTK